MLLQVQHETRLTYSAPVLETVFEVRMAPPSDDDQTTMGYRLRISPQAAVTSYRDGFGNRVDLFNVATPYRELVIRAFSTVRTHRRPGGDRLAAAVGPDAGPVDVEAADYVLPSPLVDRSPALDALIARLPSPAGACGDAVAAIQEAVSARLKYEKKVTTARTPVSEVLALGRGVCQDFAHLFIAACRGVGLPARYVSGYVNHPGEIATHAWCQLWCGPAGGWVDYDPTRGVPAGDDYVTVAVGRDYADIPPNRGVWTGRAEESIAVSVQVEPIERVPMAWDAWADPPPGRGARQSQSQSQRAGAGGAAAVAYPPYPDQRRSARGLRQQQGQQQQQQQ